MKTNDQSQNVNKQLHTTTIMTSSKHGDSYQTQQMSINSIFYDTICTVPSNQKKSGNDMILHTRNVPRKHEVNHCSWLFTTGIWIQCDTTGVVTILQTRSRKHCLLKDNSYRQKRLCHRTALQIKAKPYTVFGKNTTLWQFIKKWQLQIQRMLQKIFTLTLTLILPAIFHKDQSKSSRMRAKNPKIGHE